jgi:uncharacterized protein
MTGTVINVVAVLIGGALGTLLGNRLPARVRETLMHGLGLATIAIGIQLALAQMSAAETTLKRLTFIVVLVSILIGGIVGELLRIDARLDALGNWLQAKTARILAGAPAAGQAAGVVGDVQGMPEPPRPSAAASTFSRGFVTASLVFCVGPIALIGSLRDGISGDYTLLAIKSVLDCFAALAFASSLGVGVMFSALTVLVYQGALSLGAHWASGFLTDVMIAEMSATGGILLLGIGFMLLEIKQIRVANLLPSIFIAPVLVALAMPLVPLLG